MLSKPIFKQCLRNNGKLWAIFTFISCLILWLCMWSFDPDAFGAISDAVKGTEFDSLTSNFTTFLGTMETYYKMIAVLLGMVYVIISSTNLIASEVDSGSMAYTLSTPTQRSSVVFTKMVFMIGSIIMMFAVETGVGIVAAEVTQNCVSDSAITKDVKAAAEALDRKPSYVRDHLYIIKEDAYALKAGADERDMDVDSYSLYLDKAILRQSYKKAAKELTEDRKDIYKDDKDMDKDDIEITREELEADPSLMLDSSNALKAGSTCMDMSITEYKSYINNIIAEQKEEVSEKENAAEETEGNPEVDGTETAVETIDMEKVFTTAMNAAAEELDTNTLTLSSNLIWMKDEKAMKAEVAATGLSEDVLLGMINESMANVALNSDDGVEFDMEVFIWLNVGCCLVILAFSAIGFFASCVFNLTKNAMVLGGGLPFTFFIMSIIIQMGGNLENLKYFTITTLFDTQEILKLGDFGVGLGILAGISIVLYAAGGAIFCKKDLPL